MTTPTSEPRRLRALFERYAADLGRHEPDLAGQFRCPLCLELFSPRTDDELREQLAEEHIVPESLGGTLTTLTCRRCNNDAGSKLEKHLVQRVRLENNLVPIRARVTIGESEFGAEIRASRDEGATILIQGIEGWSHPEAIANLTSELSQQPMPVINFKGNFGYIHHRSQLAILRAAYLLMFRTFGYSYVRDTSALPVREQLGQLLSVLPPIGPVLFRLPVEVDIETTVSVLTSPVEHRCFFVVLQLLKDPRHVAGVALPAPASDGVEFYDRLSAPGANGPKSFRPLPPFSRFLPLTEVWNAVFRILDGNDKTAAGARPSTEQ